MKVTFICTVLNEEKTIDKFLDSLLSQIRLPDEIVICDGGSTDLTVSKVQSEKRKVESLGIDLKVLKRNRFNRAKGRNEAIRNSTGEIIAISDAGCVLDKKWLEKIIEPFKKDKKIEVVAGYYKALVRNVFEKCVTPYVLVMPDKLKEKEFLPASRSMAILKDTFWRVGGFPEEFSDNEDYVFAKKLQKGGVKIVFCQKAIVSWFPRTNLKDFFVMIYRFARGDAQAGLRYQKVATVFIRYLGGLFFAIYFPFIYLLILLLIYFSWAIFKNYRYIKNPLALFYLPLLQITADLAVMSGFFMGYQKNGLH